MTEAAYESEVNT